jgi:subtilisin family serine protease
VASECGTDSVSHTTEAMKKSILFLLLFTIAVTGISHVARQGVRADAGNGTAPQKDPADQESSPAHREIIRIRLAGSDFAPLSGATVEEMPPSPREYWLVQFDGPVSDRQRVLLEDAGAKVFDYVPDFAFIVKMGLQVKAVVEELEHVRWVGPYRPEYRMDERIRKKTAGPAGVSAPGEFILTVFKGEDFEIVAREIESLAGEVLDSCENSFRAKARIRIAPERIEEVSEIEGVKWIEPAPRWTLFNDIAAGIMDVPPVRDSYGLLGSGQVVAVADTGLDKGQSMPSELHDDFEDGLGGSRVLYVFDRVGDGADDVNSGHGTHVSGSVLGNGLRSGSDPVNQFYQDAYAGMAPEAGLVFQAVEDNTTEALSGIPTDVGDLFLQAYQVDARIHTNSWGADAEGAYTSYSEDVDQFMWEHQDFLVLFAAGNAGEDAEGDGVINQPSVGSPATAKNCITVGASENDRPSGSCPSPGFDGVYGTGSWAIDYPAAPIYPDHVSDNASGMAAFSSRGPCLDGRIKPDIVAPGTNVVSTRSSVESDGLWGDGGLSGGQESDYTFAGGTSMSTPLVAGAAALVREYFMEEQEEPPSAALIKAALLNGAVNMSPGQYGTGDAQEIPESPPPNNVEGWGRLSLDNALYPETPRVLRFMDVKTGVTTGKTDTVYFWVEDDTEPLKVTLAWNDYPGSPVAGGGLVNDLDLSLIDPHDNTYYPNNASQRGKTVILAYDDEGYEDIYASSTGRGFAVKFTPESYPAVLDKAQFSLYIDYSVAPVTFVCNVWDDNGPGGMPGSLLCSKATTCTWGYYWYTVDLPEPVIRSGSVYIELRYDMDSFPWLYMDTSGPDDRSYYWNGTLWDRMSSFGVFGDWAIQAVMTDQDISTPYDRVNNVVGIHLANPVRGLYFVRVDGYNIPQGPQPYALVVSGGELSELLELQEGLGSSEGCFIRTLRFR